MLLLLLLLQILKAMMVPACPDLLWYLAAVLVFSSVEQKLKHFKPFTQRPSPLQNQIPAVRDTVTIGPKTWRLRSNCIYSLKSDGKWKKLWLCIYTVLFVPEVSFWCHFKQCHFLNEQLEPWCFFFVTADADAEYLLASVLHVCVGVWRSFKVKDESEFQLWFSGKKRKRFCIFNIPRVKYCDAFLLTEIWFRSFWAVNWPPITENCSVILIWLRKLAIKCPPTGIF